MTKVKEMIENPEVSKYDNDISELIENYNLKMKAAQDNEELSDVAFLDMGKKLREVEKKIIEDNPAKKTTGTETTAKKVFAAFKLRIAKKINKHPSNVDKVYKVAEFCETETYQKYQNRLPSGWGTLYLLLSLKDDKKQLDIEKIDELMLDRTITKDIKRSDLIKKIASIKTPNKIIKQKVTIIIEGGVKPTQEQLEKLQEFLSKTREFKKQWNVTKTIDHVSKPDVTNEVTTADSENSTTE